MNQIGYEKPKKKQKEVNNEPYNTPIIIPKEIEPILTNKRYTKIPSKDNLFELGENMSK